MDFNDASRRWSDVYGGDGPVSDKSSPSNAEHGSPRAHSFLSEGGGARLASVLTPSDGSQRTTLAGSVTDLIQMAEFRSRATTHRDSCSGCFSGASAGPTPPAREPRVKKVSLLTGSVSDAQLPLSLTDATLEEESKSFTPYYFANDRFFLAVDDAQARRRRSSRECPALPRPPALQAPGLHAVSDADEDDVRMESPLAPEEAEAEAERGNNSTSTSTSDEGEGSGSGIRFFGAPEDYRSSLNKNVYDTPQSAPQVYTEPTSVPGPGGCSPPTESL